MYASNICDFCGEVKDFSKLVVGEGNPYANLMLIGEAPGEKEEKTGKPFVGRSGKLLKDLLYEAGINHQTDTYICNIVKCRPPNNRKPTKKEIYECLPWLLQQIKLIDPPLIILVGLTAMQTLLGNKTGISKIRGKWQHWEGRLVMPLFHPSYLLRNPSKELGHPKALTHLDLLEVRQKLDKLDLDSAIPLANNQRSRNS